MYHPTREADHLSFWVDDIHSVASFGEAELYNVGEDCLAGKCGNPKLDCFGSSSQETSDTFMPRGGRFADAD